MTYIRMHGDPFGEGAAASRMRSFLRLAGGAGMRCSLSLSAVVERPVAPGEHEIPLTDGVRNFRIGTSLPPAEIELLLKAAEQAVPATAPILVFATAEDRQDAVAIAGFEWPEAAVVVAVSESCTALDLIARARAELRWAGVDNGPATLTESELRPWMALPPPPESGAVVHVGAADGATGIDLVVALWGAELVATGRTLRLVLPAADDVSVARLEAQLEMVGGCWEIARAPLQPRHLADATAVLLPWRTALDPRPLVQALASGRPVCVSRHGETAAIVDRHGICCPIGGRRPAADGDCFSFEPSIEAVVTAMATALGAGKYTLGARAQRHVREHLVRGAPKAAPALTKAIGEARPRVVLEAPFFETSSSSELSIETALALARRGNVELQLVARTPLRGDLQAFRRRAPELEPLLTRRPGRADLWLSSGWPVRASRPDCKVFALRVDWEYGALPADLGPHVTDEADLVVVHSDHTADAVAGAGRPRSQVRVVPHGVDASVGELVTPDAELLRWKGELPAVLFCGGMVWRKGFDIFMRAVLAARASGAEFAVVIKSIGGSQHYRGFDLRGLVDRFATTPGTPPLLLIEDDLSRSQLAALYTACDLMLHPYRGEGFCLPVLEARGAGLPVLATAGGATDAMMSGPGAVRLPALRRELELPGAHFGRPWVLEPDADRVTESLLATLADLPAQRQAARDFAPHVRGAFSWSAAAAAIESMATEATGGRHSISPGGLEPRPATERVLYLPTLEPGATDAVAVQPSR